MYQCETTTPMTRERDTWNDVGKYEEARDKNETKLVVPSYTHTYARTYRRVRCTTLSFVAPRVSLPAQVVKTRNTHVIMKDVRAEQSKKANKDLKRASRASRVLFLGGAKGI